MPGSTKKAEDTQNVLNMMTKGIMERKTGAAAKLTPVEGETPATHVLPRTSAPFPNDMPREVMETAVRNIRREAQHLLDAADAIERDVLQASSDEKPVDLATVKKAKEKAADEAAAEREAVQTVEAEEETEFARSFKAQQEEAQAAAFKDESGTALPNQVESIEDTVGEPHEGNPNTPDVAADGGWQCSTHGQAAVKTSRLGREYRACPVEGCKEFEKL